VIEAEAIRTTVGRRRAYAALLAGCAALLVPWELFARWIGPWMLATAHRGEGFGFLARAMGGGAPLENYLRDLHDLDQRVLVTAAGVLVYGMVWIRQGWTLDRHWFAATPLKDLAIARIVVVGMQLALMTVVPATIEEPDLTQTDPIFYEPRFALRLLLAPFFWIDRPDAAFLHATWVFAVVCGVAALFGLLTRVSLIGLAWASTLLVAHSYSYGEYHHTEALMMVALWALAFSRCGAVLSLDARIRRARGGAPPAPLDAFALWPLRLVQWMFALTYFAAGTEKLVNGGLGWFKGTTLAYYFAVDALHRNHPVGIWLAERADWLPPLAVASLLFELTFPLAVLVPGLAIWFVAFGIPFHLSVYIIHGPPFFEHMALFVVFIGAIREDLAALLKFVRRRR
jgi:Vitamin K-dependent gamma-carboxylase